MYLSKCMHKDCTFTCWVCCVSLPCFLFELASFFLHPSSSCSNMEWGGGVIGWQQSTTQYASHNASDDRDSNEAVCRYQTSSFTTLVYRVDSGKYFIGYTSLAQTLHSLLIPCLLPSQPPYYIHVQDVVWEYASV